jgi:hypothetical protein
MFMERQIGKESDKKGTPAQPDNPNHWSHLIRKLRWIGQEEEAKRLETAVASLPAEQRGCVSSGPFSTD